MLPLPQERKAPSIPCGTTYLRRVSSFLDTLEIQVPFKKKPLSLPLLEKERFLLVKKKTLQKSPCPVILKVSNFKQ